MKLPVLLQSNGTECGIACLAMIAAANGRPASIGDIRRRIGYSTLGNTIAALMDLARTLDLHPRPLRLEVDEAPRLRTPCILLWGTHHFVVLKRATRRSWIIHDPAVGVRRYRRSEVARHFSGVALELTPGTHAWSESPAPRLRMRALWSQADGLVPMLAWLLALSVVLQAIALVSPLYVQLAVDDGLARNDVDLLAVLALGFAGIVVTGAVTGYLRSVIAIEAGATLNDRLSSNLYAHLLNLPLLFFVQRDIGDVSARFGSLAPVLRVFTSGIVAVLLDGVLALGTLAVLCAYHPTLAAVISGFLLSMLVLHLSTVPKLRLLNADSIRAAAAEQTLFIESLRSILSVKANGMEHARTGLWRNHHLESIDAGTRLGRFGHRVELARGLLTGAENVLVVYLGALAVIHGDLTIGMLYAFIAYKSHFVRATTGLVEQIVELRMLRLHLERLADIALETPRTTDPSLIQAGIRGAITAHELRFRYSPHLPEVLAGASLSIEAGTEVALVGGSGSGKSTLLRILLGLIEPTSGSVLLDDGRALAACREALSAGTGVVLQGDALFSGSIRDNIGLFALDVDPMRVEACCRIAVVDADIRALPMGYDTPIGDMGISLSAGQAQRLLIARALYKSPSILVLDEATANLDDSTRAQLNDNLRTLGITIIRVTHRLDEIRAATRVYRLAEGRIEPVSR